MILFLKLSSALLTAERQNCKEHKSKAHRKLLLLQQLSEHSLLSYDDTDGFMICRWTCALCFCLVFVLSFVLCASLSPISFRSFSQQDSGLRRPESQPESHARRTVHSRTWAANYAMRQSRRESLARSKDHGDVTMRRVIVIAYVYHHERCSGAMPRDFQAVASAASPCM